MNLRSKEPTIAAGLLILAGCALIALEGRHLTFYLDDWNFITGRRGHSLSVFLRPHDQHLSAIPVFAYKAMLAVFGGRSYAPFMTLLILLHGTACALLYVLARRRIGPWAALAPTAIMVVLAGAWMNLLWAFQIGFVGAFAAGLAMVLCLERKDRPGDIAAAVLLLVSLLCANVGLGFVVLAAVLLVLGRPFNWRRLWVVAAPLAAYGAWYAGYGVTDAYSRNLHRIPRYLFDALSASGATATGLVKHSGQPYLVSLTYGRFVAVALMVVLIVHLVRGGRRPPLAWAALAAVVALWIAQCLSGIIGNAARVANESRYQYVGTGLLLVAAVSLASGWCPGRRGAVVLGAVTVLICAANISLLDTRATFWRNTNTPYTHATLGVLNVARGIVAPNFGPEDSLTAGTIGSYSLLSMRAGPFFSAEDTFGSPADSPSAILKRPEKVREAADLILSHAERLSWQTFTPTSKLMAGCRTAPSGSALGEVPLGPGTVVVKLGPGPSALLRLRRFASGYRFLSFPLGGDAAAELGLPSDGSRLLWHLQVAGGRGVTVCVSND